MTLKTTDPAPKPTAILLDLDGTLYVGDEAIPGAVDAIRKLSRASFPRRYITNTTRFSRVELVDRLQSMGFPIETEELFTACVAAADWLRQRSIRRVALYLPDSARTEFEDFEIDDREPEAVVIGDLGSAWDFETLNRAFRQLRNGARLIALQKNRFWRTSDGISLDAGPFVAALEYAAGVEAEVVGKPSRAFFELAISSLEVAREGAAIVGDDIRSDTGGGQAAGLLGFLVRTGKFDEADARASGVTPDGIADSLADLVAGWGL